MFERIVVLDGSERAERVIPIVASVEISEKDVADAASYLAALKTAYAGESYISCHPSLMLRKRQHNRPWLLLGRKTKNMEVKHGTPLARNHHYACA